MNLIEIYLNQREKELLEERKKIVNDLKKFCKNSKNDDKDVSDELYLNYDRLMYIDIALDEIRNMKKELLGSDKE